MSEVLPLIPVFATILMVVRTSDFLMRLAS